jgi:hypothetical protein
MSNAELLAAVREQVYDPRKMLFPAFRRADDQAISLIAEFRASVAREGRERATPIAASLAAAISLLERGGKKAAPSDKMFAIMLNDYRRSLEDWRALPTTEPEHG